MVFSGAMTLLLRLRLVLPVLACAGVYLGVMIAEAVPAEGTVPIYIGTYTGAKSKGIYMSRFDLATGKLTSPELAAEVPSPSFLALHPTKSVLYAAGETSNLGDKSVGTVEAFRIEAKTGRLTLISRQSSGGAGPCHVAVDQTGACLLVANYGSGSIAAVPIREDGGLGELGTVVQHKGSSVNPARQAGPHAHFIVPDPANRFALACDLGLDQVLVYRLNPAKAELVSNEPSFASVKPGSGPRHLVFDPTGQFVFLINEIGSTLTTFAYDARQGVLKELQTVSTLPVDCAGKSFCAEVQVHPSGKFVYGSNRGHDSIVVFGFDSRRGKLKPVQYQPTQGKTPRHVALDPSGQWLLAANQDSDTIVVFRVDARTGRLSSTGQSASVSAPVCVLFAPAK